MNTPAFALSADHEAADIRVSNANAALQAAEALRQLSLLIAAAACEVEPSEQPGDRNDLAFCGLADLAETAGRWANEAQRKGHDYRKGLI